MKKERSCSGGMFEFPPTSPNASRRNKDSKQTTSSTRLRYAHGNIAQLIDLTIFRIPGLDVKVGIRYYFSNSVYISNKTVAAFRCITNQE